MNEIVVTGGTGFLGRATLSCLVARGHQCVVLARRADAASDICERHGPAVEVCEADLSSAQSIKAALRPFSPKVVYHLAGGRVGAGSQTFSANLASNLSPTTAIVAALEGVSLDAFILASTGEVYGPQVGPFHEDLPTCPRTAYAASKVAAEALVLAAHKAVNFPTIVARLGVVYGPGPWASKTARPPATMLPALLAAAVAGNRFPMSSGTQTRDFLYVEDAARALVELSQERRAVGQIVNVGTGRSEPVGVVAERLLELLGRPIALDLGVLDHNPNEIFDYRLDTQKLVTLVGFSPRWTLEQGLREMVRGG